MSWYQLLDIRREARQEWLNSPGNGSIPPLACPRCGEPLLTGPTVMTSPVLYCRFDGWQYPRDWVRPSEPAGLFGGVGSAGDSYAGPAA